MFGVNLFVKLMWWNCGTHRSAFNFNSPSNSLPNMSYFQLHDSSNVNRDAYVPNPSCKQFGKYEWIGMLMGACLRSNREHLVWNGWCGFYWTLFCLRRCSLSGVQCLNCTLCPSSERFLWCIYSIIIYKLEYLRMASGQWETTKLSTGFGFFSLFLNQSKKKHK